MMVALTADDVVAPLGLDTMLGAAQRQADLLMVQAQLAHERGYVLLSSGLHTCGGNPAFMSWECDMLSERTLVAAALRAGRKLAVIRVWHEANAHKTAMRPLDRMGGFHARLPRAKAWAPVCAAIELMSARARRDGGKRVVEGQGAFTKELTVSYCEYTGTTREALDLLVSILDMPHHRAAMTAPTRKVT